MIKPVSSSPYLASTTTLLKGLRPDLRNGGYTTLIKIKLFYFFFESF